LSEDLFGHPILLLSLQVTLQTYPLPLYPFYYIFSFLDVHHPQHTQTSSNSSTIAADSSNGVTNTRCCRYSCMRS
jgi:hypothetical protein